MPRPFAAFATSPPIAPSPMTPSFLPSISHPANLDFSFSARAAMPSLPFSIQPIRCRRRCPREDMSRAAIAQLLYSVCVCSGSVEYNDPLLSAALYRDIVHARAGSSYRLERRGKGHVVHFCGADKDRVGIGDILSDGIFCGVKAVCPDLCDFVEQLYIVH